MPETPPVPPPESHGTRLRRLSLRSVRRGTREMDLILQDFAARALPSMSGPDLDAYESLLEEPDPDLLLWITGALVPPDRHAPLVARIRAGAQGLTRPDRAI